VNVSCEYLWGLIGQARPGLVIDYGLEMGDLPSAFHASFGHTGVKLPNVSLALAEALQLFEGVLLG